MDYHFPVRNETVIKSNVGSADGFRQLVGLTKKLFPVLLLAAVLPVFYFFTQNPPDLRFASQADQNLELRLWIDPASVVTSAGNKVELTVMASFESDTVELPALTITLQPDTSLVLDKTTLSSLKSFSGQTVLGRITAFAARSGKYTIAIPIESVEIVGLAKTVTVSTSPATITIK